MELADIFVGSVSAAIGVMALAIAAANWTPGFNFWVGYVIDARWGRTRSRIVYAIVGTLLIALGIAIMLGFELADHLDLRGLMQ
jgi:hypothetical protein